MRWREQPPEPSALRTAWAELRAALAGLRPSWAALGATVALSRPRARRQSAEGPRRRCWPSRGCGRPGPLTSWHRREGPSARGAAPRNGGASGGWTAARVGGACGAIRRRLRLVTWYGWTRGRRRGGSGDRDMLRVGCRLCLRIRLANSGSSAHNARRAGVSGKMNQAEQGVAAMRKLASAGEKPEVAKRAPDRSYLRPERRTG